MLQPVAPASVNLRGNLYIPVSGRLDPQAVVSDMLAAGSLQPHMTVDAGAGVPAGLLLHIDEYRQPVRAILLQVTGDVKGEIRVSVDMPSKFAPVEPYRGLVIDPVEDDAYHLRASGSRRKCELLDIQPESARKVTGGSARLTVERQLDAPVMRDLYRAEFTTFRRFDKSFHLLSGSAEAERPALVESIFRPRAMLLCADSRPREQQQDQRAYTSKSQDV